MNPRRDPSRVIRAPRGNELSCKSWLTEAPLRMLMNNLDPDVAEHPEELVVYGGIGRAARDWVAYDNIVETLRRLALHDVPQIVDMEVLGPDRDLATARPCPCVIK